MSLAAGSCFHPRILALAAALSASVCAPCHSQLTVVSGGGAPRGEARGSSAAKYPPRARRWPMRVEASKTEGAVDVPHREQAACSLLASPT